MAHPGRLADGQPGVPRPSGRSAWAGRPRAVAAELGIGRAEQDEWALRSHQRAAAAWDAGLHDDYVLPVEGPSGTVKRDESIRADTTIEKLAALKPAFSKDGTATAGNSSPVNDGAVAVLVGSPRAADELGAAGARSGRGERDRGAGAAALLGGPGAGDPQGAGPGRTVHFGHRGVGDQRGVRRDGAVLPARVPRDRPGAGQPVNGGAIAIGHPLGASAPRVVIDACRELRRRGGGYAVAAACIGVGQGTALVLRVDA